jgi:squalene-hopene/tetraprenyl-beta-curcumene cyclase
MKTALCLLLACAPALLHAQKENDPYLSLKLEIERAIKKGNAYLKSQQAEEGYWGDPTIPAVSALALTAAVRDPNLDEGAEPAHATKGYEWLLAQQKDDGGIYGKGLASYNTSSSLMSLVARGKKEDEPALLEARAFLINQQTDWGIKGDTDNKYDGGIGYGGSYAHSDLSNTYLALEALYNSRQIARDGDHGKQPELDWQAALAFVSRCQNLEATNDQPEAIDTPENKGGFVYFPGNSKAGTIELEDGTVALRSYGSMSYSGLLSLVYADLDKDDPRVTGVLDWLGRNYTLEENPGLGMQGLYYYYHAMAKSLSAAGIEKLPLEDGTEADWRLGLGTLLVSSQSPDGSWINENSRWWENDQNLVTAYVVLTLEQIYYTLP